MDISGMMGVITGLKATKDLAGAALSLASDTALVDKLNQLVHQVSDVQAALLDTQAQLGSLMVRNHELEHQLRDANDRLSKRAEFDRYTLAELAPGSFVFRLRENCRKEGEPMHNICPLCKESGTITYLREPREGAEDARCPKCEKNFRVRTDGTGEWEYGGPCIA